MEKQQNERNGGGFVLGILVGMAMALLFTTKKGRRILDNLLENGWEKIADWETIVKETFEDSDDEDDVNDDYMPIKPSVHTQEKHITEYDITTEGQNDIIPETVSDSSVENLTDENTNKAQTDEQLTNTVTKMKSTARRFFKGIPKRG